MVLEAQNHSQCLVNFVIEKTKFYGRFEGQLNARQEKVLERMFAEGIEGFKGGLSAENYIRITKTSRATATAARAMSSTLVHEGSGTSARSFPRLKRDSYASFLISFPSTAGPLSGPFSWIRFSRFVP